MCCTETDGLVSGGAFVVVLRGTCSDDLIRWEPAYSGVQLARLGAEVELDGSPEFESPLWSLEDIPSAANSALALSSHFPLTVSILFATRWVGVHFRVAWGVVIVLGRGGNLLDVELDLERDEVRSKRRLW